VSQPSEILVLKKVGLFSSLVLLASPPPRALKSATRAASS